MLARMPPANASPLEVIRAATRSLHERIDNGAFAKAVLDGSLTRERYASFLRAVHTVMVALEEVIERSGSATLRAAFVHGVERRARLVRDLDFLQTDLRGIDAAVLHAMVLGQRIRLDARLGDAALLGHLYVLEGSQLGGLFQKRALEKRDEFQGGGLAYLSGAGRDTQPQFRAFVAKFEAALADEAAVDKAVIGATHAFAGFEHIVCAVMSERLTGRWLTAPLNVDAGMHPVPTDLREVQAALRAGEESFRSWAYYEARYGERGLAFTRSDSCWLVTLAREDGAQTVRQVKWLGGVLAARGMPRILLEHHLEQLHACLIALVPECASAYATLREVAAALRNERSEVLDPAEQERLASGFSAPDAAIGAPEAGALLVAATIDDKLGIAGALSSLCGWLGDPARFSAEWRAAVEDTVQATRAAMR